ncbi:MAG: hypothetical protein AAGF95_34160 [Chloroflexota bacterium]
MKVNHAVRCFVSIFFIGSSLIFSAASAVPTQASGSTAKVQGNGPGDYSWSRFEGRGNSPEEAEAKAREHVSPTFERNKRLGYPDCYVADTDQFYNERGNYYVFRIYIRCDKGEVCHTFSSKHSAGAVSVGDLVDIRVPFSGPVEDYLNRIVPLGGFDITEPMAYILLTGKWCFDTSTGQITSLERTNVTAEPTRLGDWFVETHNTRAGEFEHDERDFGQIDYLNEGTRTDIILEVPNKFVGKIPGTEIGFEIPAGTKIKVGTIMLRTRLTGQGSVYCSPSNHCEASSEYSNVPHGDN